MKRLQGHPTTLLWMLMVAIFSAASCTEDNFKPQESTKELMATASAEKTVAFGEAIKFTDYSLGVVSRQWTFPGGTPSTSNRPEVEVIFSEEGNIAPTLKINYFDGSTETKTFNVRVFPKLVADFTQSATRIKVGETVTFTDNSVGNPTGWSWVFEGGTPSTSTARNPTITFNENKPVTIKLTVTRADDNSSAVKEKVKVLQVGPPELCLNGNFETGLGNVVDWQTWNGAPFPYTVEAGGALGTAFTSVVKFKGAWGWGQIISRDFPNNKIALENGRSYNVSLYIRADAPVRLDQFRGVNHMPDWSPAKPAGGAAEGYEEFYDQSGALSLPVNVTTSWTKVSIRINVPDDGKSRTNFFPDIILGGGADSNVYIDEISVKVVE